MLMVKILGGLLVVAIILFIIKKMNELSYKEHRYNFFNYQNYLLTSFGYGALYFGREWYMSGMIDKTDTLNGVLLFLVGLILLLGAIYINIKNTNFLFVVCFEWIQLVLYAGLALIGAAYLVLLIAIALSYMNRPYYDDYY